MQKDSSKSIDKLAQLQATSKRYETIQNVGTLLIKQSLQRKIFWFERIILFEILSPRIYFKFYSSNLLLKAQ